nr:unnamed protein product [Digitaria exilis]
MQEYHPAKVITVAYQPFVLGTTAIFTYYEAKINTRLRILAGYMLFFFNSFAVIVLDVSTSGGGGIQPFVGTCIIAACFGVANGHVQGVIFFSMSCFFELLCLILYAFIFPRLPIVIFYRSKAASDGSLTVKADLAAGGIKSPLNSMSIDPAYIERLSTKQLLLQNIDYVMDLFLTYVVTISIVPGFLAEDTGSHSMGSWYYN